MERLENSWEMWDCTWGMMGNILARRESSLDLWENSLGLWENNLGLWENSWVM